MTEPAESDRPAGDAANVDDEFAHIPRMRGRHPLLAVAGAALAFFLVFHIRRDLRYALSSSEPLELGSASRAFADDRTALGLENRYVRVAGTPDRESALEIDTKGSWVFSQLFRVLGTGDRLFLHRRESPLPAWRAEADVFEGRLIRADDLSFADAIRRYFSAHVAATHFFAPDVFAKAVAARVDGAPIRLGDRAGDSILLPGGDTVAIDVARPEEVRVGLPRGRFPDEQGARDALVARGGQIVAELGAVEGKPSASAPQAGPLSATPPPPERWTFVVRFSPADRQAALDAIGDLDSAVEIRDARRTIEVQVADVTGDPLEPGGLVVRPGQGPPQRLAPASLAAVHTSSPVLIPADAFLLVEGDQPREHLPTVIMALILLMFGTVNLLGLARDVSR